LKIIFELIDIKKSQKFLVQSFLGNIKDDITQLLKKIMECKIPKMEILSKSANRTTVQEGKFYKTSCRIKGINGEEFCAYFTVIMLDIKGKEILRRIRWLNDFSGKFSTYEINCRAEPQTQFMVVGYFANGHGANKSDLILELSELQDSKIIETEDTKQIFDELYDYKLIWKRNKGTKKEDYEKIGQTKKDFEEGGQAILSLLKKAGLRPNSKFLDVGCGFGRTTNALMNYLNDDGKYYGIDVGKESVEFCRDNYQRKNFIFIPNEGTEIPINDVKFDMMLFSSVFTHLYPDQIKGFLKECRMKLNDNGVIVADILEKNDIEDYTGMVSKVIFNRKYFEEIVHSEGFDLEVLDDFGGIKWNVDKRPVFKLIPK